jgi:hypothetical protein
MKKSKIKTTQPEIASFRSLSLETNFNQATPVTVLTNRTIPLVTTKITVLQSVLDDWSRATRLNDRGRAGPHAGS